MGDTEEIDNNAHNLENEMMEIGGRNEYEYSAEPLQIDDDVLYDSEHLEESEQPAHDVCSDFSIESEPSTSKGLPAKKINRSFCANMKSITAVLSGKKFRFQAPVYLKKFKNQKSSENWGTVNVDGDTTEEVVLKIWEFCSKFVYRAVSFSEPSDSRADPKWAEFSPKYDERDTFIVFQDQSSKKNIAPSKVDSNTLVNWLVKEVFEIVYKYSESVTSLEKWRLVENQLLRPLETDRSGAESVTSINRLKEELKRIHGKYLSGDDVNWGCWACWISSKPYDQREDLKNQAPPEHLINLFCSVPVHSDTILVKARLDLQVANTVNSAFRNIIGELKNDHQQASNILNIMGEKISMMEAKQKEYDDMLAAMNTSVSVKENKFSVELAHSITNCLDVDHDLI
ncbi:uncharacterized protein LOC129717324 [Wyeomyia smithii]|uniref:uncharacterized protein LOC129717324 n=1 Tax=Wyeomyia smithii TaxID=174621 RepID=UPI0024680609|nr:uncharacterized protein LOC129717324 [Wyeomyia smithii]